MIMAVVGFAVWYFQPVPAVVQVMGPVRVDTIVMTVPTVTKCLLESTPYRAYQVKDNIILANGKDTSLVHTAYIPMTWAARHRLEQVWVDTWPLARQLGYVDTPWWAGD